MYLAHTAEDGRRQTVKEHLLEVAEQAKAFSVPAFRELAYAAGMGHDLGKYTDAFQQRIQGGGHRTEHSIQGAMEYAKLLGRENPFLPMLEYCIAGHHTGLPDGGTANSLEDTSTLQGRMKRKTESYLGYQNELRLPNPDYTAAMELLMEGNPDSEQEVIERYAFFTRYLFSCLTDADFLNTESFCQPEVVRGGVGDFPAALEKVKEKLRSFQSDNALKRARTALMEQACAKVGEQADIYILNMPTGSGKTLCSIRFALEKAIREGKERIIYVIPYTSIIEQTAREFETIFGEQVEILQHHSNYSFDREQEEQTTAEKLKRACENWDAKVIVTTSVQFFESLYHNKGSKLRKLHNMANAVIVFDEIHLIPLNCFQPCIQGIGFLTKYLGSCALLLSATMPDYEAWLNRYLYRPSVCQLISDKSLFSAFDKCSYQFLGEQTLQSIAAHAKEQQNSLIVVNTRKEARELYQLLSGKKYHLSTYMCPAHRTQVIDSIRADLALGAPVTVVSTSLIEAGVDLDFAAVYRELAGLDSILQAGGRCNRNGLRPPEESTVYVFSTETIPAGDLQTRAQIGGALLRGNIPIQSPSCIEEYFRRLLADASKHLEQNRITAVDLYGIPFAEYARTFRYIADESIGVVVPYSEEAEKLISQQNPTLQHKRKLQPYTVSIRNGELKALLEQGILREQEGILVLTKLQYLVDLFCNFVPYLVACHLNLLNAA